MNEGESKCRSESVGLGEGSWCRNAPGGLPCQEPADGHGKTAGVLREDLGVDLAREWHLWKRQHQGSEFALRARLILLDSRQDIQIAGDADEEERASGRPDDAPTARNPRGGDRE